MEGEARVKLCVARRGTSAGSRVTDCFFFFFQAEDGIRDYKVTGVQTCALPISSRPSTNCCEDITRSTAVRISAPIAAYCAERSSCGTGSSGEAICGCAVMALQIGRASCRERV